MSRLMKLFLSIVMMSFLAAPGAFAQVYKFSGGPSGGTFQYYASAISTLAKKADMRVLASSSGGAIENIRLVNANKSSFGITYSGHVWAARNGKLKNDEAKYEDVLVVAYLYGAPAQLVVKKASGITEPAQLADKRVGVGNAGSGAAANAEIFFTQLGIWDKMGRENLGYRQAADAFKNGHWTRSGCSSAIPMPQSSKRRCRQMSRCSIPTVPEKKPGCSRSIRISVR